MKEVIKVIAFWTALALGLSFLVTAVRSGGLDINLDKNQMKYEPDFSPGKMYSPVIRILREDGSQCSAVVITPRLALTAAHCCVLDDDSDSIKTYKGKFKVYPNNTKDVVTEAKVGSYSSRMDIGVIKGDFTGFTNSKIQNEDLSINHLPSQLEVLLAGNPFKACGYPLRSEGSFCFDYEPSAFVHAQVWGHGYVAPGMSGGGLFDARNSELLAIIIATSADANGAVVVPVFKSLDLLGIEH